MAEGGNRKILRIGIIQNKKFVEERLLRKRHAVTVGQGARNTFAVPSPTLPPTHTLFDLRGGVYHLCVTPSMTGKVGVDASSLDFEGLKARGLAEKQPDGSLAIKLSDRSRGRVVMGDVTLLFQFVVPPPPASRLQLPASVRGGILHTLDWPFVSTLLASFVVQVFSIAFIVTRDYPEPPRGIETLPDRFAEFLRERPETKPQPKEETAKEDEESEEKDPEKKEPEKKEPEKKPKKVDEVEQKARKTAEKQRQMAAKVQNNTIIKFLGTKGGDGEGGILDQLKDGHTDTAMADAFDGAAGMVADGSGGARDRRRSVNGTGKVAGLDQDAITAKGGGPVSSGSKGGETKVSGEVKIKRLRNDEMIGTGVLDSNSVSQVVSRRRSAIKNCYEKRLKVNNKLAGKVKISFTIEQSGRVRQASVAENTTGDPAVGTCIVSQIKRWRFPKPDGGSVTVAFPFVFTPST